MASKKKRMTKLSISQEKEIVRLYCDEKISSNNIAKLFCVSPTTITNKLRKNNIIIRAPSETMSFHSDLLTGRPPTLNINQELEAIRLYCENELSAGKVGELLSVSHSTIENTLHKHNILVRSAGETNKLSTKFTFHNMTKEKAFVLGVIFGDGSISIRKDYINVTSGDLDILEKVQKVFGDKFKIKKVKGSNCYSGVIYSHKLCDEMFDIFGIKNNKSDKLIFPKLSDELMPSFISGYLATDGCITIAKNKSRSKIHKGKYIKPSLNVLFYSCSNQYLMDLKKYLELILNINVSFYERKNIKGHLGKKPLYTLQICGSNADKFINYIINNTDIDAQCDRKINVYNKFIKTLQLYKKINAP